MREKENPKAGRKSPEAKELYLKLKAKGKEEGVTHICAALTLHSTEHRGWSCPAKLTVYRN